MNTSDRINWSTASHVARRFSGEYPLAGTYHEKRFKLQAPDMVARASEFVVEETGLELSGAPVVDVISRDDWVDTNIRSFGALLEPLEKETVSDEESCSPLTGLCSPLTGRVTGAELGVVLGFMSKRVLGQYELVLPTGDETKGDSVLFVGANVLGMERRFEFRPSSFRLFVALHECSHRAQFIGVPWMREYFFSLVEELVNSSVPEDGRVRRIVSDLRRSIEGDGDLLGDAGLIGLLATPQQREVLDKIQALMSLLEGHGHIVMDRIGRREITDVSRMTEALGSRRRDPRTAVMMKLLGIEMKMKQYENGERFIREVEKRSSWEALSMAWESPEALPTLLEIEDASLWLDRMSG